MTRSHRRRYDTGYEQNHTVWETILIEPKGEHITSYLPISGLTLCRSPQGTWKRRDWSLQRITILIEQSKTTSHNLVGRNKYLHTNVQTEIPS